MYSESKKISDVDVRFEPDLSVKMVENFEFGTPVSAPNRFW